MATPIDVLCSHCVKFGRREICKIVRYLGSQSVSNIRLKPSFELNKKYSGHLFSGHGVYAIVAVSIAALTSTAWRSG